MLTYVVLGILGFMLLAAIGLAIWLMGFYNQLVTLKDRYANGFSQVEIQLKRRYDLIPSLVETVKGYMSHERETLEAVIQARNQASNGLQTAAANPSDGAAIQALAGAEVGLTGALGRMFALSEAYPDLKANQNMAQLTEELTSTENKVAFARQAYNDSVTSFNIFRKQFPGILFAGMIGYAEDAQLLEFADSEQIQAAPKVSF